MKTILIVLPDHFSIRNFVYSPFIEQDFKSNDMRVVFVLKNPEAHLGQIKGRNNIILEDIEYKKNFWQKIKNRFVRWNQETLNYRFSKIKKLKHISLKENIPDEHIMSHYDRFSFWLKFPATESRLIYNSLYWLYNSSFFSEPHARKLIKKYKPSLVITTNPQMWTSRAYYLEAKKKKIKTFTYVNSWDYLTTDGPVMEKIDEFITWNERMGKELKNVQKNHKPVHNIGPLHFDYSFHKDFIWSKEKINRFLGIPIEKDFAIYGVCGARIGKHEPGIALHLAKKLSEYGLYLVIRGHPEDQTIPKRYQKVIKEPNVNICMGSKFDDLQKIDDRIVLYSLLTHMKLLLCGPTTLTLDGIRFGKPIINIGFDGNLNLPPQASVAVRYTIDHFAPLLTYNGIYYVKNFLELNQSLHNALSLPRELAEGQKKIRDDYLEPLDGKASERMFALLK